MRDGHETRGRTTMPILKYEKVEAGKITKNDIVKGRTAAVVKIGTKFAEVRDADGKMILRAPLRQTVAIMRPTPTDEEVAAKKAEREAERRTWREESISSWLDNADDRYAAALAKFSEPWPVAGLRRTTGTSTPTWPRRRPSTRSPRTSNTGSRAQPRPAHSSRSTRATPTTSGGLTPATTSEPRLQRRVALHQRDQQRAGGRLVRDRRAPRLPRRPLLPLRGIEIMNQNPTKIVGYCRVSTVEQADNGHSIDAQRAAITAAAETRGWEILWVEDAASAKDLDRPGLGYALSMLGSCQAGGIVVSRLDRLSRSVHDLAILLKRARAEGWNVVMLDYGLDLSPRRRQSPTDRRRVSLRNLHQYQHGSGPHREVCVDGLRRAAGPNPARQPRPVRPIRTPGGHPRRLDQTPTRTRLLRAPLTTRLRLPRHQPRHPRPRPHHIQQRHLASLHTETGSHPRLADDTSRRALRSLASRNAEKEATSASRS